MYTNNINPTNTINPIIIPDVINISDKNPNAKFKYADTLTILIRTRIRGYPTILYTPSMSVPNMKSNNVYFNPVIKLNSSTTSTIPRGYPPSERMSQFFYKNKFNSLEGIYLIQDNESIEFTGFYNYQKELNLNNKNYKHSAI